ncbi:Phosphoglucan water dikinase PWD [Gracilaria domingensis]|nr:Phosphoglucan water dikinase PWD [Gracilaria domingensis]
MPVLELNVKCEVTEWGEEVAVVGSWNSWNKKHFTKLATSPADFPVWKTKVSLTDSMATKPVEYKYVIVKHGHISKWEGNGTRINRVADVLSENKTSDVYGSIPAERPKHVPGATVTKEWLEHTGNGSMNLNVQGLGDLERAIIRTTMEQKSWRQRLSFIRSLFTDERIAHDVGFDKHSIDALATVSTYLSFLSSGQVRCEEDGGHHRPNHHAQEAQQLEAALESIVGHVLGTRNRSNTPDGNDFIPYVVRKIYPQLPSYSSQFTTSVPLTRIRDIAHRNDIPHDFKQEIKHTLQNKLHRCAGPEDLQTSARLLDRIHHGNFSHGLKEQFSIFHRELCEFFNASSLDDRLHFLSHNEHTRTISAAASRLLAMKGEHKPAYDQLIVLTELRQGLGALSIMTDRARAKDLSEHVQKIRLADVELENYAFLLLAGIAKIVEDQNEANIAWSFNLHSLSLSLSNIGLSGVIPPEANAAAAELSALHNIAQTSNTEELFVLRAKAAVDRALRLAHRFCTTIAKVYEKRAATFGHALGVDRHAVSVFAEAEIRANVTFQASRIANTLCRLTRKILDLPPWDPLYNGCASGRVVFAEKLGDVMNFDEDVIAICRQADGDEDIHACVRGVILGRSLAHLSHLGVRARQSGVVFVCAEDQDAFEVVWNRRNLHEARMLVTSDEGLASLSPLSEIHEAHSFRGVQSMAAVEVKVEFDARQKAPISISEATKSSTSSKCALIGKVAKIAADSEGVFFAANGVALPHGMFQEMRKRHEKEYDGLVSAYERAYEGKIGVDEAADGLRHMIEAKMVLEEKWCKTVQKQFDKGCRVMVRSSANAEDLENMSGAEGSGRRLGVAVDTESGIKSQLLRRAARQGLDGGGDPGNDPVGAVVRGVQPRPGARRQEQHVHGAGGGDGRDAGQRRRGRQPVPAQGGARQRRGARRELRVRERGAGGARRRRRAAGGGGGLLAAAADDGHGDVEGAVRAGRVYVVQARAQIE